MYLFITFRQKERKDERKIIKKLWCFERRKAFKIEILLSPDYD